MIRPFNGVARRRNRLVRVLVPAVLMLAAGCAIRPPGPAGAKADLTVRAEAAPPRWSRHELYFGMSRKDAPDVTPEEFDTFLADEITPRFPDGLTVIDGRGQWRTGTPDNPGIGTEPTRVVVILVREDPRTVRGKVEAVAAAYRDAFAQQSVLWVRSGAAVEFLEGPDG